MTDEPTPMMSHGTPMPHGSDAIAIVNLVMNQIDGVEHRIKERIDGNADAAMRRWRAHDEDHNELARAVKNLASWQEAHDNRKREERVVFDARIGPVRSMYRFLVQDKRWMIVFGYIGIQATEQLIKLLRDLGIVQ